MKRNISVLLAALLVLSIAGQAAAYFDDLNLIRSIYTATGTVEVGTDLGQNVSQFTLTSPTNTVLAPNVAVSAFDGSLDSLVVGYWSHNQNLKDFYVTGAYLDGDGLAMARLKQSTGDGTMNATQTLYGTGSGNFTTTKTTLGSYYNRFEVSGGNVGSFGSNLSGSDNAEMSQSLAALATVGYIDQYLYYFNYDGSTAIKNGTEVAVIRTFLTSDGSTINKAGNLIATVINPYSSSTVPVPAAVWLLGTGIVALVGIRRRNS